MILTTDRRQRMKCTDRDRYTYTKYKGRQGIKHLRQRKNRQPNRHKRHAFIQLAKETSHATRQPYSHPDRERRPYRLTLKQEMTDEQTDRHRRTPKEQTKIDRQTSSITDRQTGKQ